MISAIAAVDENFGIGYEGKLLCHIKEDLKYFKRLTIGNIVVMGRATWDSLSVKPLQDRVNIVVTNSVENAEYKNDLTVFMNPNRLKKIIKTLGKTYNIYIIGGGQIYREFIGHCDYIHLTKIHKSFENVDTYFPKLDGNEWKLLGSDLVEKQEDIEYHFEVYQRKVLS